MKYLQRYLSLLLALALSLGTFSITASAAEFDTTNSKTHLYLEAIDAGVTFGQADVLNGETGTVEGSVYHNLTGNVRLYQRLTVANNDGSIILPSGYTYTFYLENITFNGSVRTDSGSTYSAVLNPSAKGSIVYYFIYADGSLSGNTTINLTDAEFIYNDAKKVHSLKFDIPADKDILKIHINEYLYLDQTFNFNETYGTVTHAGGFVYPMKLTIDQEDKEVGLLDGILGGVTNIFNKVNESFEAMKNGFNNVVDSISNLPAKIWEFIENGLKSLFVPSEESMTAYKDKWDELLASRLGAVYQVVNILTESWDEVMAADQTDTIEFPSATINLAGTPFTFGGYTVQIVPEGFSVLVSAVKIIVGIVCTIAFVNGLRKRYDEIMGVEQ